MANSGRGAAAVAAAGDGEIGLATVVCALILLVAAPREWLGPALLGLAPVAIFAAYRKWLAHQRAAAGPENVWIDAAGVHWLDAAGQEQVFTREGMVGFRVGRDEDTLRPVPSLTLSLAGGFESQPIELHGPATPEAVRGLLAGEWQLPEQAAAEPEGDKLAYDLAVDVYSECHDDFQEWHFEGTRGSRRIAGRHRPGRPRIAPSATGAKPARRVLLCRRRHPIELRIARLPAAFCGDDRLGGPAEWLAGLSQSGQQALAPLAAGQDGKFNLTLAPHDTWTLHLHVRDA